jgi:hypothetical protein
MLDRRGQHVLPIHGFQGPNVSNRSTVRDTRGTGDRVRKRDSLIGAASGTERSSWRRRSYCTTMVMTLDDTGTPPSSAVSQTVYCPDPPNEKSDPFVHPGGLECQTTDGEVVQKLLTQLQVTGSVVVGLSLSHDICGVGEAVGAGVGVGVGTGVGVGVSVGVGVGVSVGVGGGVMIGVGVGGGVGPGVWPTGVGAGVWPAGGVVGCGVTPGR